MSTNGRLGAAIRKKRIARKLSLRGLAREVEVSPTYLSMIERGLAKPSQERAAMIAKALAKPNNGKRRSDNA